MSGKSFMNGGGESYSGVIPGKQPNKSEISPAEVVEERPQAKENTQEPTRAGHRAGQASQPGWRASGIPRFDAKHPNIRGKNRVR
jgi:hypothetical protein